MEASLPLWIKQPTGCGDRVNPSTVLDAGKLEWVYTPRHAAQYDEVRERFRDIINEVGRVKGEE
jgi:hypothetical protein